MNKIEEKLINIVLDDMLKDKFGENVNVVENMIKKSAFPFGQKLTVLGIDVNPAACLPNGNEVKTICFQKGIVITKDGIEIPIDAWETGINEKLKLEKQRREAKEKAEEKEIKKEQPEKESKKEKIEETGKFKLKTTITPPVDGSDRTDGKGIE